MSGIDLITAVINKRPSQFADQFDAEMKARLQPEIEARKLDYTATFFAGKPVYTDPESVVTDEQPQEQETEDEQTTS